MDKEIFVTRLKSLAPSKESLRSHGLPNDFIYGFVHSYFCNPKSAINLTFFTNDPILNLLQCYDCSKVEIGIITFIFESIEKVNYHQIGMVEQDILSINKTTLSVDVLDYADTSHVIWKCASSSGKFLEALLTCAEFFTSRITDSSLIDNNKYTLERVNSCAEKAGGDEYRNFYEMLLGYID